MADSAAHLRDCVFPSVPVRQWVFTLPKRLRFLLAWRPKLISLMLRLFLRALFAWQRRCARKQGIAAPLCGAVSFVQRFGSALNLNIHVHAILPDGVFFEEDNGQVRFHPLFPPKYSDLEKLIRKLVPGLLRKLGDEELPEHAEWMLSLCQALATGAPAQATDPPRGLGVFCEGFSLHAGVFVSDVYDDRDQRLCSLCGLHISWKLGTNLGRSGASESDRGGPRVPETHQAFSEARSGDVDIDQQMDGLRSDVVNALVPRSRLGGSGAAFGVADLDRSLLFPTLTGQAYVCLSLSEISVERPDCPTTGSMQGS